VVARGEAEGIYFLDVEKNTFPEGLQ